MGTRTVGKWSARRRELQRHPIMSFLEKIEHASDFLERNQRVSLRALQREFGLDASAFEDLVGELVDVLEVAVRDGELLVWAGTTLDRLTPEAEEDTLATKGPSAQRRQLTVMFCDLVGSTRLARQLGAEDFREVLRAYQEAAASIVERYDGHVAQYLGDGILVYFGYPSAHDDDPELAVRAARDIVAALAELNERLESEYGIRIAARIGIHTGRVVVGEMGGKGTKQTLALGDTTHIAARLQDLAEPGAVVISGATLRLVPGVFVTKDMGTPPLRGVAERIRAYEVVRATGIRNRLQADPSRLTPFVGRHRELGLLLERESEAQEGDGQAVLIAGEAGVGKSRLLQAFHERLVDRPHTWLECRCTPYAKATAFFPLIEILEQGLGFTGRQDPETKLRALEYAVERVGLAAPEVVPIIAALLRLPLPDRYPSLQESPGAQRRKTIDAMVAWILALAEEQLTVVVFEDLHWSDYSTLEVVKKLLERSDASKVLTLITFRPHFDWGWEKPSHVSSLEVQRLWRRQAETLVSGMNHSLRLPADLVERIVERADGVPLFLEELTKLVLESGFLKEHDGQRILAGDLDDFSIPTTLEGSLMARLDRLSAAREVAQRAAVLGRSFPYRLAAAAIGFDESRLRRGLERLVEAQILHQRGEPPDAHYLFKHALLQEAAYESLLRETRQRLHGRVVDALLEQSSDEVAPPPEVTARHAEAAGRLDVAVDHYRRAGLYAQERSANEEAVAHFLKAIKLLGPEDGPKKARLELSLQLGLGASLTSVRGYAHPERRVAYERARELAEALDEAALLGQARIGVSISECTSGAMEVARSLALDVLDSAQGLGDDELALHAHSQIALSEIYQGRFESSLEHCKRALALYDVPRHHKTAHYIGGDTGLSAMGVSAWCLWHLGYPDQALARARETVALARRLEDPFSLGFSTMVQATIHWLRGEFDAQEQSAADEVSIGKEYGFPVWLGLGEAIRGAARVAMGNATAVSELERGVALIAQSGIQSGAPMLLAMVAATKAAADSIEEALGAVDLAFAVSAATGQAFQDAELHRLKGELVLVAGRKNGEAVERAAEQSFRNAADVARAQGAPSFELRALTSLARLLCSESRISEARELLEPVVGWFEEGLDTEDLRRGRVALEALDEASRDRVAVPGKVG